MNGGKLFEHGNSEKDLNAKSLFRPNECSQEGKHKIAKYKSLHLCKNNRTDHKDKTNIHTFLIVKLENNIIFKQKQMYMMGG